MSKQSLKKIYGVHTVNAYETRNHSSNPSGMTVHPVQAMNMRKIACTGQAAANSVEADATLLRRPATSTS